MPDSTCRLPGCSKPKMRNAGVCSMHAARKRRYGSFDLPVRTRMKDEPCAVAHCDENAQSRGYCKSHYDRVRKYGDPLAQTPKKSPIPRFMSHVNKTETCWLWTGSLTYDGYAIFSVDRKRTGAHRWAYELFIGPIPDGLQIDHVLDAGCTNRHCVNPAHLEPVTATENMRRQARRRREESA